MEANIQPTFFKQSLFFQHPMLSCTQPKYSTCQPSSCHISCSVGATHSSQSTIISKNQTHPFSSNPPIWGIVLFVTLADQFRLNMRSSSTLVLEALACLVLVLTLPWPSRAANIQCSDVVKDLSPCVKYLSSGTGAPPKECCSGVNNLATAAATPEDRRTVCGCIQSAVKRMQPNAAAAKGLAGSCGISLTVDVSPNTDCSK